MKFIKRTVAAGVASLAVCGSAFALPGFSEQAPASSIEICVAQISAQANYEHAARIRHEVDSKARRVGGHTIKVDTTVFGADGRAVIREYATVCAVTDKQETRKFTIKEKGVL
tara:strand:+ start:9275 stop:9613 length:339 start_codon:yes stop_codon:yes gene_type:complete